MSARMPIELVNFRACTKCGLHLERHNVVLGSGDLPCEILIVGEGPGEIEDLRGRPFVGRSGKLLRDVTEIVIKGLGIKPPRTFITNMVCCRPTEMLEYTIPSGIVKSRLANRPPTDDEMRACRERLHLTYLAAKPKVVLTLGATAGNNFKFASSARIVKAVHPAYVLRFGSAYQGFIRKIKIAYGMLK